MLTYFKKAAYYKNQFLEWYNFMQRVAANTKNNSLYYKRWYIECG